MGDELFETDDKQTDPDFDKFWSVWPKKADRKRTEKRFAQLPRAKKLAAIEDAGKRQRAGWWAHNPLMLALTYINGERWDDEWQPELERKKQTESGKPNTGGYVPREPRVDDAPKLDPEEVLLNRVGRDYILVSCGLPEIDTLKRVKTETMKTIVPAFREDIEAGTTEKSDAYKEMIQIFLSRLDADYGMNMSERVWAYARKRQRHGMTA